jgi:hypothetical protein
MKNLTLQLRLASLLSLILLACMGAYGQLTPAGDSYTNTAASTTNYGAKTLLDVESTQTSFIQFDLSAIPAGYTSADITKASLKLYVNAVTTAGSFNVDYVNGTWTESTIDASNAPALGTTIAASVPLITKDKNQYILVDVTAAVQAWLSGTANDGIALVANSPLNASFDSKESTTTSHPPELDIVFAGGGGSGITGITTAAGSGLIGGGTSGTLNLSLLTTCASGQVLQWNGTAWKCASAGTGTITGVTAGTDLLGGGTSGNVTLSLNTAATNGLYAQLGAATNTFSGSAFFSGFVDVIQNGSSGNAAILGQGANGSTGIYGYSDTGYGVEGVVNSAAAIGVYGANVAGTGSGLGVYGTSASTNGFGVEGTSPYIGVVGSVGSETISTDGAPYGTVGASPFVGVYGTSSGTAGFIPPASGVWGDTGGPAGTSVGITGTASNNTAGVFENFSQVSPTLSIDNATGSIGGEVFLASMTGVLGFESYAIIGDPGCGESSGNWGLQLGQEGMSGCSNYTLLGNTAGSTYLNAVSGQTVHLRINNSDALRATSSGVAVVGTLSKGGGSFMIDHPLDPANKYLYHSFVESPDMMNIYNGNVTTDASGEAAVELPDWFEALNRDFRYQLTVIGQFAQAIVAGKVANHQFLIKTDKPNVEVSWQVTGIRQDAFANANRIPVEVEKAPADRGRYLYPEAIGAPATARIGYEAVPPGNEQIVHHQRPDLLRRNASPAQSLTLPAPPKLVLPKTTPLPHVAGQANKPEVNQK